MTEQEIIDLITAELGKHTIYETRPNRSWPDSLYFGRYYREHFAIRISNHDLNYVPWEKWRATANITIIVREGMTREEVLQEVERAVAELTEHEDQLARDEGLE